MAQVGDAQQEADRVQDVAFTGSEDSFCKFVWNYLDLNLPIQTSDSVKLVVKPIDFCSLPVGLEPINHHGLYKHSFNSKTV